MEELEYAISILAFIGLSVFAFVALFWGLSDIFAQKRHERAMERSRIDG